MRINKQAVNRVRNNFSSIIRKGSKLRLVYINRNEYEPFYMTIQYNYYCNLLSDVMHRSRADIGLRFVERKQKHWRKCARFG